MADGSQDRYVVIRDNKPTAVMLPTERYESLIHPEVEHNLRRLGKSEAKAILKVIEERIINGELHKLGKPLNTLNW